MSAWDFRNAYGLPSPGFELIPVYRSRSNALDVAFIGDSVDPALPPPRQEQSLKSIATIPDGASARPRAKRASSRKCWACT